MPRKRRKQSKGKQSSSSARLAGGASNDNYCPRCHDVFQNLSTHYNNSPICARFAADLVNEQQQESNPNISLSSSTSNNYQHHMFNNKYSSVISNILANDEIVREEDSNQVNIIKKMYEQAKKQSTQLNQRGFSMSPQSYLKNIPSTNNGSTKTLQTSSNSNTSNPKIHLSNTNNTNEMTKYSFVDRQMLDFYQSNDLDDSLVFQPDTTDVAYSNMSKRKVKQYFSTLLQQIDKQSQSSNSSIIGEHYSNGRDDQISPTSSHSSVGEHIIQLCESDVNDIHHSEDIGNSKSLLDVPTNDDEDRFSINDSLQILRIDNFVPSNQDNHSRTAPLNDDFNIELISPDANARSNNVFISNVGRVASEFNDNCDPHSRYNILVDGIYLDLTTIQSHILQTQCNICLDDSLISSLQLLKLSSDSNIPGYLYHQMIDWHQDTIMRSCINSGLCSSSNNHIQLTDIMSHIPRSRNVAIEEISKLLYGQEPLLPVAPIHTAIRLPSKQYTRVSRFDFKGVLFSYLLDPELMKPENCLYQDPIYLDPSILDNTPIELRSYDDIHTGSWFRHAHSKICKEPEDVLCPIILFIDGTPIDQYGHLNLEPVLVTLGLFRREMRNKPSSWRVLGYIPEEELHVQDLHGDNHETVGQDFTDLDEQTLKRTDYHHILSYILQDIVEIEKSTGILWNMEQVHPQTGKVFMKTVRLKFTVMFVIGDALGHDKLCDRFTSYNSKVKFLCRDCNCPTKSLSDLSFKCEYTNRSTIKAFSNRQCREKSFYKILNNAFDLMKMGYDLLGINGCCPPELLHQFLLGVIKKLNDTFLRCCTVKGLKFLDKISKYIAMNWHRNSARDIPSIQLFKDGILSKKKLTGNEEISMTFILYLCLCQSHSLDKFVQIEQESSARSTRKSITVRKQNFNPDGTPTMDNEGNNVFETTKEVHKVEYPKVGSTLRNAKEWVQLFEYSLCFYYWLKLESVPASDVNAVDSSVSKSKAEIAIDNFLLLYMKKVNEESGTDINSLKIHQCRHIPHYIRRFSSCLNFDGSVGERNIKSTSKNPARRTQQRSSVLAEQAANRYFENTTVQIMHNIAKVQGFIKDTPGTDNHVSSSDTHNNPNRIVGNRGNTVQTSGSFRVYFDDDGKVCETTWAQSRSKRIFHKESFLMEVYKRLKMPDFSLVGNHIDFFTCLKLTSDNGNKNLFRADPYFFKKPWFDWCETKWEGFDETFPSRIFMFIDPSSMTFLRGDVMETFGDYWAVTRNGTTDDRKKFKRNGDVIIPRQNTLFSLHSNLFDSFTMEKDITVIDCSSINSDLFVCCDISKETNDVLGYGSGQHHFSVNHVIKFKKIELWARIFIEGSWRNL